MQNHLSSTQTKCFILVVGFKKKQEQQKQQILSFFPKKMNANYTELCRVGNLAADFQQVTHPIFLKFSQYCSKKINNLNSAKK